MNRPLNVFVAAACLLLTSHAATFAQSAPPATPGNAAPAADVAQGATRHIAILQLAPFNNQVRFGWIGKAVQDDLLSWMNDMPGLRASLPGEDAQKPMADDKLAIEAARRAGANLVVYGSFQLMDPDVRIIAKLADANTGRVIGAARATGPIRELFRVEDSLGQQVRALIRAEMGLPVEAVVPPVPAGEAVAQAPNEADRQGDAAPRPGSDAAPQTPIVGVIRPGVAYAPNQPAGYANGPSAFTTYGTVGNYPNAYNPITGETYPGETYIPFGSYLYPYYFSNSGYYYAAPIGGWCYNNFGYGSYFGSVVVVQRPVYALPAHRPFDFSLRYRGRFDNGSVAVGVNAPAPALRPQQNLPRSPGGVVYGPGQTGRPSSYTGNFNTSGGGAFRSAGGGNAVAGQPYPFTTGTVQVGPMVVRQNSVVTTGGGNIGGFTNTHFSQGQVNNNMMRGQVNNGQMTGMTNSNFMSGMFNTNVQR
ncbi:MAG: hypothetical protein NTW19_20910 [Planctomycetota bacterium]|nr:hypothetical protein [Planctomycetota bacterium]